MVAVSADTSCLVCVNLELVSSLVAGAAVLEYADYLCLIDWFFTHVDHIWIHVRI